MTIMDLPELKKRTQILYHIDEKGFRKEIENIWEAIRNIIQYLEERE